MWQVLSTIANFNLETNVTSSPGLPSWWLNEVLVYYPVPDWYLCEMKVLHGDGGLSVTADGLTFAVLLVGVVGAVSLSIAALLSADALAFDALELHGGADGAVLLVAAVVALGEAVAAPRHGDAVDVSGGAGELLRGAGGGLCEGSHHIITLISGQRPMASQASSPALLPWRSLVEMALSKLLS